MLFYGRRYGGSCSQEVDIGNDRDPALTVKPKPHWSHPNPDPRIERTYQQGTRGNTDLVDRQDRDKGCSLKAANRCNPGPLALVRHRPDERPTQNTIYFILWA